MSTKKRFKLRIIFNNRVILVMIMVVLALSIVFFSYSAAFAHRVLPHVKVGTVAVGGLTVEQATPKIQAAAQSLTGVNLVIDNETLPLISLTDLGISIDVNSTVNKVFNFAESGTAWQRFSRRIKSMVMDQEITPVVNIDLVKEDEALTKQVYQQYETTAQEVSLKVNNGQVEVVPGKAGLVLDKDMLVEQIKERLNKFSGAAIELNRHEFAPTFVAADAAYAQKRATSVISAPLTLTYKDQQFTLDQNQIGAWVTTQTVKPKDALYSRAVLAGQKAAKSMLVVDLDQTAILKYVKTLAFEQLNRDPQDARVRFNNNQVEVFQPSVIGVRVREDDTVQSIYQALIDRAFNKQIDQAKILADELSPSVTENSLADLGIKELIGRAATTYATSPANRKHNISVGANKINGTIVKDGGEFSAVAALGEVDAANGYLPELVISDNKLERQYGGGLCQPITTLFRAVLDAGLPVTDRSNHSRRVSYYEAPSPVKGVRINWDSRWANLGSSLVGYDATVYIPAPDLKFKNDTGHAILVQAYITNNREVTFEIYGTNDGRQVDITKAQVLSTTPSPGPQFSPDPTKPSNTMDLVEKAVPGAKTSFDYTITYADGHKASQTFTSFYRAIPAQYLVGTAEPTPIPDSTTDPNAIPAETTN